MYCCNIIYNDVDRLLLCTLHVCDNECNAIRSDCSHTVKQLVYIRHPIKIDSCYIKKTHIFTESICYCISSSDANKTKSNDKLLQMGRWKWISSWINPLRRYLTGIALNKLLSPLLDSRCLLPIINILRYFITNS